MRRVCFLALFAIHGLQAQADRFEGKKVVSIRYDPPTQPLSPADLERVQQLSVGAPYSSAAVSQTIDRMFQTGVYADIRVDAEPTGNGIAVTYLTKPILFVGHGRSQRQSKIASQQEHLNEHCRFFIRRYLRRSRTV